MYIHKVYNVFWNYMNFLQYLGLKSKSPLINKAVFKFWFVLDCAVYQQATVVRQQLVVKLCRSFMYSFYGF